MITILYMLISGSPLICHYFGSQKSCRYKERLCLNLSMQ